MKFKEIDQEIDGIEEIDHDTYRTEYRPDRQEALRRHVPEEASVCFRILAFKLLAQRYAHHSVRRNPLVKWKLRLVSSNN